MGADREDPARLRVGIIGAGRVGTAIARLASDVGHEVSVAGSGTPEQVRLVARFTMPGVHVGSPGDVVADADLVVVAVPLKRFSQLETSLFVGRIVVDVMNYWEPLDGHVPGFSDATLPTSEIVQRALPGARVVKTLNHIGYHELESDARPPGAVDRRALAVAADDEGAARLVAGFVDSLGFDPVLAGSLRASLAMQPGTTVFEDRLNADRTRAALDAAASTALQEA